MRALLRCHRYHLHVVATDFEVANESIFFLIFSPSHSSVINCGVVVCIMKSEPTREGHKTTFFGRDFGLSEVVREGGNFVVAVRRGR